jgi:hypothetical protein
MWPNRKRVVVPLSCMGLGKSSCLRRQLVTAGRLTPAIAATSARLTSASSSSIGFCTSAVNPLHSILSTCRGLTYMASTVTAQPGTLPLVLAVGWSAGGWGIRGQQVLPC